ncbi:MAG: propanediol utilization protein [Rhodobacteraceae bacterium]|nr:propanediol utilization protein [Paracoccaceae bacterium]
MSDKAVNSGSPCAVPGHFGEWLQGRFGPDGPLALITIPCPLLQARVVARGAGDKLAFSSEQLDAFCAGLGLATTDVPALARDMPLGAGAGASTATLVALARSLGFSGPAQTLAHACLQIEGATDPLMFDHPDRLLWASRRALVLRHMPPPPACEIIGGYWGPASPTLPEDEDFPDISDLIQAWPAAARSGQPAQTADLATSSANRTTAHRGPGDAMPDLARDLGALGHIRAHTGSARGLIFPPDAIPSAARAALREAGLHGVFQFRTETA